MRLPGPPFRPAAHPRGMRPKMSCLKDRSTSANGLGGFLARLGLYSSCAVLGYHQLDNSIAGVIIYMVTPSTYCLKGSSDDNDISDHLLCFIQTRPPPLTRFVRSPAPPPPRIQKLESTKRDWFWHLACLAIKGLLLVPVAVMAPSKWCISEVSKAPQRRVQVRSWSRMTLIPLVSNLYMHLAGFCHVLWAGEYSRSSQ